MKRVILLIGLLIASFALPPACSAADLPPTAPAFAVPAVAQSLPAPQPASFAAWLQHDALSPQRIATEVAFEHPTGVTLGCTRCVCCCTEKRCVCC